MRQRDIRIIIRADGQTIHDETLEQMAARFAFVDPHAETMCHIIELSTANNLAHLRAGLSADASHRLF